MRVLVAVAALTLVQACDGPAGGDLDGSTPGAGPAWIRAAADARYVAPACAAPSAEACNAIDDDCDGAIDEDCDFTGADVQVTLFMLDELQVTMTVHGPVAGHRVSRVSSDAEYGGYYESSSDDNRCRFAGTDDFVESAYWEGREPDFVAPSGTYRVELAVTSDCSSTRPSAPVRIGVSVRGEYAGAFEWDVPFEEFGSTTYHQVLELDVP